MNDAKTVRIGQILSDERAVVLQSRRTGAGRMPVQERLSFAADPLADLVEASFFERTQLRGESIAMVAAHGRKGRRGGRGVSGHDPSKLATEPRE